MCNRGWGLMVMRTKHLKIGSRLMPDPSAGDLAKCIERRQPRGPQAAIEQEDFELICLVYLARPPPPSRGACNPDLAGGPEREITRSDWEGYPGLHPFGFRPTSDPLSRLGNDQSLPVRINLKDVSRSGPIRHPNASRDPPLRRCALVRHRARPTTSLFNC